MSTTETRSTMAAFLEEHPRLVGWLFATAVVLAQAGAVAASGGDSVAGP